MRKQFILGVILAILIISGSSTGNISAIAESTELTPQQKNAIAMVNHITVLTHSINESKNSRLFLEEAYSSLLNNTNTEAVDYNTRRQIDQLVDTMENFRMLSIKRDRLRYIYEQNQAQAIRAAVPNPIALISASQSIRPSKIAASIFYMAVDSVTSYTSHNTETDLQYLKDGWMLDDEEAEYLHNSRKGLFNYRTQVVSEYRLPDKQVLTESDVEDFVKWKNSDNVSGRILFLQKNEKVYKSYGGYWLTCAESYFSKNDYNQCLDAIKRYEELGTNIFRKDFDFARILPLAISAAEEVYEDKEYIPYASQHAEMIIDNSHQREWGLHYFVAQIYFDLYSRSEADNEMYLYKAYDILLNNINLLAQEQRAMNKTYLAPVQEVSIPKDATKDEKNQINNYNKMLQEIRKKELPPVNEYLLLNCDLLFEIANNPDISDELKENADDILHLNGERLFLSDALDNQYWFDLSKKDLYSSAEIEYAGTVMVLPVSYLTSDYNINVTVKASDNSEPVLFSDWEIEKIERKDGDNSLHFHAILSSKNARTYEWKPNSQIHISIASKRDAEYPAFYFIYITSGVKQKWYDYFKIWEGHKNEWYDYLKVWENSVEFTRSD